MGLAAFIKTPFYCLIKNLNLNLAFGKIIVLGSAHRKDITNTNFRFPKGNPSSVASCIT